MTRFRLFVSLGPIATSAVLTVWACGGGGGSGGDPGDGGPIGIDGPVTPIEGGEGDGGASLCSPTLHVDTAFGQKALTTKGTVFFQGTPQGILRGRWLSESSAALERLLSDGSVDPTFDAAAFFAREAATIDRPVFHALRDGSVLVGWDEDKSPRIAKLRTDGRLDTGFGENGILALPLVREAGTDNGFSVARFAEAADGSIVIVGAVTVTFQDQPADVYLARASATGKLDTTFGQNGSMSITLPYFNQAWAALPVAEQKTVLAIYSADRFIGAPNTYFSSLFRVDGKGVVDSTFGRPDAGVVLDKDYDDERCQLQPQGETHWIVSGLGASIRRLGLDGQPDPTFGAMGTIPNYVPESDAAASSNLGTSALVTPTGTIVATRRVTESRPLAPAGQKILTYDRDGKACGPLVSLPFALDDTYEFKLALATDGSIFVLWQANSQLESREEIVRVVP